ncbi:M14 family metallopeptidase [candidate division KSB1 bacterium]
MKTKTNIFLLCCILLTGIALSCQQTAGLPDALFTRAEKTNYEETSLHADVMDFVTSLTQNSDIAKLEIIGSSKKGREIPLVIMADPPVNSPAEAQGSGKLIVYIQGNIHSGEVEGKEASMELMRDIAFGHKGYLLENQILLFVPIYNADGNDSLGAENRGSQEGSPVLTGTRSSGEGYDLNRDGLRIEALETKAMIKNVINKWDPEMFYDLHTTNGTWHGYALTYAPGEHTAGHPATKEYLMENLFPEVSKKVLERSGIDMFHYGGFRGYPPESMSGAPPQPRYITNSLSLKNKLSILVETFAHDRFEKRILSNTVFLTTCLEYSSTHSEEIREVARRSESETIAEIKEQAGTLQKGLSFRSVQRGEPQPLLVYIPGESYTDERGRRRTQYTDKRVWIDNVRMMHDFEPTRTATVPRGYVFPAELKHVAEKLMEHGVEVQTLDASATFAGEEFTVTGFTRQEREYQKHHMASIEGSFSSATKEMPPGSYLVDLAQPYAYLVFYMLEPEADDGLTVWNYFDDLLIENGAETGPAPFPVFKYYEMK